MHIMNKNTYTNTKPKSGNIDYTFNVCYLREYMDPEHEGDFFYAYETVYRNIPYKYKNKFNTKSMKMKIIKFCDWNYKESAKNFANSTRVELIDQDQYCLNGLNKKAHIKMIDNAGHAGFLTHANFKTA